VSWDHRFFDPIVLSGRKLRVTLRDAAQYIIKLPKAEHDSTEWQAAMEALLLVAEQREERCIASGTREIRPRRGDLPVGQFCVESHLQKYFASPVGQIISTNPRHPTPPQGAYRDRHGRGVRMRWTRQRFACDGIAGRVMSL
jgi:hypothetical protein